MYRFKYDNYEVKRGLDLSVYALDAVHWMLRFKPSERPNIEETKKLKFYRKKVKKSHARLSDLPSEDKKASYTLSFKDEAPYFKLRA